MKCRHCNNKLKYEFLDLGVSAPSNSFIKKENLNLPEKSFPLRVMVCDACWLVQTEDFVMLQKCLLMNTHILVHILHLF